jgi:hypothetical protein
MGDTPNSAAGSLTRVHGPHGVDGVGFRRSLVIAIAQHPGEPQRQPAGVARRCLHTVEGDLDYLLWTHLDDITGRPPVLIIVSTSGSGDDEARGAAAAGERASVKHSLRALRRRTSPGRHADLVERGENEYVAGDRPVQERGAWNGS